MIAMRFDPRRSTLLSFRYELYIGTHPRVATDTDTELELKLTFIFRKDGTRAIKEKVIYMAVTLKLHYSFIRAHITLASKCGFYPYPHPSSFS